MAPLPVVLGLTLCDYVIVEEGTRKLSLIGTFTTLAFKQFPTPPRPFSLFLALTDGVGHAKIDLVMKRLQNGDELHRQTVVVEFAGKLEETHLLFRVDDWNFPDPGWFEFSVFVDGNLLAQRKLEVK